MFDALDAKATSFPTPTTGTAGHSALPDTPTLPADVESWPAGHRLARLLDDIDPMGLSDQDRIRYVQSAERLAAHVHAQTLAGIGAIHDSYRRLELDDHEAVNDGTVFELRSALSWTRRYAQSELDFAVDLLIRLPVVLDALHAGRIDKRRAGVIVDDTAHLSVAHARHIADRVLEEAAQLTTGQLRNRIRRICLDTDPEAMRMRRQRALADRQFTSWTEPDGTMSIQVTGIDPVRGQELLDRINRIARELNTGTEPRTMDQLRADVAVDLLTGTDRPTFGSIHLIIDLARLADPKAHTALTLAGYGPILEDVLDQIDRSGTWTWTAATTTGVPGADGHTRRKPTAGQQRRVRAAHPTCIAPGCRMPARACDLDHTTPYAERRWTESIGLAPLCRKDHTTRHTAGWTYAIAPDGTITWHSPLGTTYRTNSRDP